MKTLRVVASRIGIPGLAVWLLMIGSYLSVRVKDGSWRTWDLVKWTAIPLVVAYGFGAMREEEKKLKPYVICTSCAKRTSDPGGDLAGWTCGHCKRSTLVRVGTELPT